MSASGCHTMKRVTAVVATTVLTIGLSGVAAHAKPNLDRACRYQLSDDHAGWTVQEVRWTIRCSVERWPISGGLDKAMAIAYRESRFHQFAHNASGYSGVYQWAHGTWSRVLDDFKTLYRFLGHGVFNARSNVMYAIKYVHNRGWGPWGG